MILERLASASYWVNAAGTHWWTHPPGGFARLADSPYQALLRCPYPLGLTFLQTSRTRFNVLPLSTDGLNRS